MKKKNKSKQVQREKAMNPKRIEADDVSPQKLPNADRHVDDLIRKYNDFALIDQD